MDDLDAGGVNQPDRVIGIATGIGEMILHSAVRSKALRAVNEYCGEQGFELPDGSRYSAHHVISSLADKGRIGLTMSSGYVQSSRSALPDAMRKT